MKKTIKLYYHHLLPKKFLTWIAHILANSKIVWLKNFLISDFLKKHAVNMQEALEKNPLAYSCFNDFFTRKLDPSVRTISTSRFVCPADGAISEAGPIHQDLLLQAKGIYYSIEGLLKGSAQDCKPYFNGSFVTIYLSPKDYHRIHMPVDGKLVKQIHIPGKLYSVQPFTTENIPDIFTENERLVLHFETSQGPMVMVMVGATIVGCIGTAWQGDLIRPKKPKTNLWEKPIELKKGEEVGYFKLGSTVIVILPPESNPQWVKSLQPGTVTLLGEALAN